ncbi:hypothetical protein VNI00_016566 [Paramarasmius palmivorus]|uniref:DNA-binding protein RAP1 n=1 Tax=Paramarasmius palmivorus TaxID=297713 RepID=A0AAW0BCR1_9AGAR
MSQPNPTPRFSKEDDELLIAFIAKNNPAVSGRKGTNVYKRLVEEHSTHQTWSQWKSRYIAYAEYYDRRIAQILGPDFVQPTLKSRVPYTAEDSQNLVEYLAKHTGESARRRGTAVYKALAENRTGDAPWGLTRTSAGWRDYYKRNKEAFDIAIKDYQTLHGIVSEPLPREPTNDLGAESDDSIPSRVLAFVDAVQEDNRIKQTEARKVKRNQAATDSQHTTEDEFDTHIPSVPVSPSVGFGSFTDIEGQHASSSQIGFGNSDPTISVTRSEVMPEPVDSDTEYFNEVIHQIPRYGIFTPHDDLVLLKFISKKRVANRKAESLYQELVQTIPAAGRHTAQAWRTRYTKHQHVFDRLVSDYRTKRKLKGKEQEKRRHTLESSSLKPAIQSPRRLSIGDLWGVQPNKRKRLSDGMGKRVKRPVEVGSVLGDATPASPGWMLAEEGYEALSTPERINAWTSEVHEADMTETEDELAEEKEISQYLLQ